MLGIVFVQRRHFELKKRKKKRKKERSVHWLKKEKVAQLLRQAVPGDGELPLEKMKREES